MLVRELSLKDADAELKSSLIPVIQGLGMSLIELSVYKSRGRQVQVKLIVQLANSTSVTGIEDCSRVHKAVMARLELTFPERDIYLEVSSPGIERLIKYVDELPHYIGREIMCYRTDISDWTRGKLLAVEAGQILLGREEEELAIPCDIIAKARLSGSAPIGRGG